MDITIKDKINSKINDMLGADFNTVSFVSPKNTDVEFVQFVIKTNSIEKPAPEEISEVAEAPLNFWQKLLKLFGIGV